MYSANNFINRLFENFIEACLTGEESISISMWLMFNLWWINRRIWQQAMQNVMNCNGCSMFHGYGSEILHNIKNTRNSILNGICGIILLNWCNVFCPFSQSNRLQSEVYHKVRYNTVAVDSFCDVFILRCFCVFHIFFFLFFLFRVADVFDFMCKAKVKALSLVRIFRNCISKQFPKKVLHKVKMTTSTAQWEIKSSSYGRKANDNHRRRNKMKRVHLDCGYLFFCVAFSVSCAAGEKLLEQLSRCALFSTAKKPNRICMFA